MGVTTGGNDGGHFGQSIARHVGHNISPYRHRSYHCRDTTRLSRVIVPTPTSNQRHYSQQAHRTKCRLPKIDNGSHSCKCIWE